MCRERFRVHAIEGLQEAPEFNHFIEFGSMWHVCEESLAAGGNPIADNPVATTPWELALKTYAQGLVEKFPTQGEQIEKWYQVCKHQFPIYVRYWKKHPDVKKRQPLFQEEAFNIPYTLPSGKTVRLRGKFDSVDVIDGGIYLQENKTKGDIDEINLPKHLGSGFELQTMFYLVALTHYKKLDQPINGVRYNVVRRPLSGGKGSIKPLKGKTFKTKAPQPAETMPEYYKRLQQIIIDEPDYFFMRWKIEVSQSDIDRFRVQCLDPILENLCLWYDWVTTSEKTNVSPFVGEVTGANKMLQLYHYRFPYGVYNPLLEGRAGHLDEHLQTGSVLGLEKATTLFPELE